MSELFFLRFIKHPGADRPLHGTQFQPVDPTERVLNCLSADIGDGVAAQPDGTATPAQSEQPDDEKPDDAKPGGSAAEKAEGTP